MTLKLTPSIQENLLKNDIFSTEFDKQILKSILPKWFYKKYMKNSKSIQLVQKLYLVNVRQENKREYLTITVDYGQEK